jgi:hypothetical protein
MLCIFTLRILLKGHNHRPEELSSSEGEIEFRTVDISGESSDNCISHNSLTVVLDEMNRELRLSLLPLGSTVRVSEQSAFWQSRKSKVSFNPI